MTEQSTPKRDQANTQKPKQADSQNANSDAAKDLEPHNDADVQGGSRSTGTRRTTTS
jgi:hypothetical protein